MSSIVDEVKVIISDECIKNIEGFSKYIEAQKFIESLQDNGVIIKKTSRLLPIEERYKSVYVDAKAY